MGYEENDKVKSLEITIIIDLGKVIKTIKLVELEPSMDASLAEMSAHQLANYPDINHYSLIVNVDGISFLYRPEKARVILLTVAGVPLSRVQIKNFSISSCHLNRENLEGFLSGTLHLVIGPLQQPKEQRTIALEDVFVRLYPIRAYTGSTPRQKPRCQTNLGFSNGLSGVYGGMVSQ